METENTIQGTIRNPKRTENVIEIRGLHMSFGSNRVLKDFNFVLHKGENVVVLGKSGSGKSVLIKCIIGLLSPDSGSIYVFGRNIPELSQAELDSIRIRVGFLFQSNALYDSMTVRENLEFPLRRHRLNLNKEQVNELVMEMLENVGLPYTVNMMPSELSGGMKKRIALARTLILKPDIILYDEPTTGLDPITGREISELMLQLQKKYNTSSIIISHDMKCVEFIADRIVVLINGTAYAEGDFENLRLHKDPLVHSFFD
ncbi:MAG: ATP-binding cassette domain-containing protein [Terrimonas sp.]|nr:ATP-binding cassette domain-containing protein [Terrimonas sp.]